MTIKRTFKLEDIDIDFITQGLTGSVDVDDMTNIHMGNIEGEILTIAEQLNKVGFIRSLAERAAKRAKFEVEIYAAKYNSDIRKEASLNSNYFYVGNDKIKLTENSLKEALLLDKLYQKKMYNRIEMETNYELASTLYWGLNEKAEKLNRLMYTFEKDRAGKEAAKPEKKRPSRQN